MSSAEILRKFSASNINFSIISANRQALILQTEENIDSANLMDSLGGTIKIAKIEKEVAQKDFTLKNLDEFFENINEKITYGISAYGFPKNFYKALIHYASAMKKMLAEKNISARFVPLQQENFLSSVQVEKNNLLKKGFELIVIGSNKNQQIYIGKTESVQNFEAYNLRDYGRPFPNPAGGMLPPKVAQIMINLSALSVPETRNSSLETRHLLYDPFCGSGTILQEALLLGNDVIGSDISKDEVANTQKNLAWLSEYFSVKGKIIKIFVSDIANVLNRVEKNSVDLIVTEPFLGPALRGAVSSLEVKRIIENLAPLYNSALEIIAQVLKKGGMLVMIFPKIGTERLFAKLQSKVQDIYSVEKPIAENILTEYPEIFSELSKDNTIFYARPDAKLIREIAILKKK